MHENQILLCAVRASSHCVARKEFGDRVTLVTSHVAAPENRGAGEYEVVFAIDEPPANTAAPREEASRETRPETPAFAPSRIYCCRPLRPGPLPKNAFRKNWPTFGAA